MRLVRYGRNYVRVARLTRAGLRCAGTTYIHPRARLSGLRNITIGSNCCIGNCTFYGLDRITVGQRTIIGDQVYLCTGSHDIQDADFRLITKPIHIGDYVWLATGATVLPGVRIGDGAVVGARAVVARDVPAGAVVAGNPARVIRTDRRAPAEFDPLRLASVDYYNALPRLRRALSDLRGVRRIQVLRGMNEGCGGNQS